MKKFEAGKTYQCRSICDYDCVWTFTVLKRTEKFITIYGTDGRSTGKDGARVGVRLDHEGNETVSPFGRYSMAPVLRATEVIA